MDYAGLEGLIIALGDGDKNTALEVRTILTHFLQAIHQPGDIKPVYCTDVDLAADYDSTGLGIGKRAGWAICNGFNGTQPIGGRTIIGYSDEYPDIGYRAGSKDAVVVAHTHGTVPKSNINNGATGGNMSGHTSRWDSGSGAFNDVEIQITGVSGQNKNMQPYIVLLYIQKL